MQRFRILHFRDFVLEKSDAFEGIDILDAIDAAAAARAADVTVEIWSEKGKVGTVEPCPAQHRPGVALGPGGPIFEDHAISHPLRK